MLSMIALKHIRAAWLAIAFVVLVGITVAAFCWEEPLYLDDGGRPRTLRHRIECKLEDWGVIKRDPFRHIVG